MKTSDFWHICQGRRRCRERQRVLRSAGFTCCCSHMLRALQGDASILSAALEAAKAASSQDGHMIAAPPAHTSSTAEPHRRRPFAEQQQRQQQESAAQIEDSLAGSADGGAGSARLRRLAAAGTGRLVAGATRVGPKPATESLAGAQ